MTSHAAIACYDLCRGRPPLVAAAVASLIATTRHGHQTDCETLRWTAAEALAEAREASTPCQTSTPREPSQSSRHCAP